MLQYCHNKFGRNLTNEEFSAHIQQQMGIEVPREAVKQYRNGRRFRLYFYQMIAHLMGVPLSDFIYEEADAKVDRLNSVKRDFVVLYDLESGEHILAVGHDTHLGRTVTDFVKVLQVTAHNNGTQVYKAGQLLLVDTQVQTFNLAGVYVLKKGSSVVISELDTEPPEGQSIVGKVTGAVTG